MNSGTGILFRLIPSEIQEVRRVGDCAFLGHQLGFRRAVKDQILLLCFDRQVEPVVAADGQLGQG